MNQENNYYTLITGATSGIGYELAKCFAKDKHNVVLVARTQADLDRVASELKQMGVEVIAICKDLFNPNAPQEIYDELKLKQISVSILVNNAGQGEYGLFLDTDLNRELDIIQLNINAYVALTKLFLKDMTKQVKGQILNVSSVASKLPGPYQAVYHGTKAFVQSWSEAIRSELEAQGVGVTTLLPGPTDTDFFNKAHMNDSKIVQEGELADPKKVAEDGYKALMKNKDMIISGAKNKIQVAMSSVTPDETVAGRMKKMQEPSRK